MSDVPSALVEEYTSALEDYLAGGGETALQGAYELGRKVMLNGLGVLDLAEMYHESLATALLRKHATQPSHLMVHGAADFFAASLSPFEMVQRGFEETNALRRLNEELAQHVARLPRTKDPLGSTVQERERTEETLRRAYETLGVRLQKRTAGLAQASERLRAEIAERQQIEKSLRESEERFRTTFEQAAVGIAHVQPDGQWLRVNQKLCEIVGYEREELLEGAFQDITHPDDLDADLSYVRRMLAGDIQTYSMEKRYIRKDGSLIWINLTVSLVRQPSGEPKYFIAVVEDISERKRIQEALRESEERTRLIIETALDAVVTIDAEGRISGWNAQAESVFGRTRAAAVGQLLSATIIPPRYREAHKRGLEHYLATGEGPVMNRRIELTALHRDGQEFPIELAISPIQSGGMVSFSAFVRDITERQRAEEEIRTLNAELEQRVLERTTQLEAANKELEAFSYSVSHDLRAPLRSIDGFSQALLEDYADRLDDEGMAMLQRVRTSSQRMAQLIDDLLDLSRVTRSEIHRETVDLGALVHSIAADFKQTEPGRQVEWVIADGLTVEGDTRLLRIALENLLGNAWKFTGKRARGRIEFGFTPVTDQQEGRTVYFVRDDGAGFDMAYASKLFGAFQRLHGATEFPGTGIGLATVQRILQRHGGQVWAEGAVDQGATFYFTL